MSGVLCKAWCNGTALLRKAAFWPKGPFPVAVQATASISDLPRVEKRVLMAPIAASPSSRVSRCSPASERSQRKLHPGCHLESAQAHQGLLRRNAALVLHGAEKTIEFLMTFAST